MHDRLKNRSKGRDPNACSYQHCMLSMKDKIGRSAEWTIDKDLKGVVDSSDVRGVRPSRLRLSLAAGSVEIASVGLVLLGDPIQDKVVGRTEIWLLLILLVYCSYKQKCRTTSSLGRGNARLPLAVLTISKFNLTLWWFVRHNCWFPTHVTEVPRNHFCISRQRLFLPDLSSSLTGLH